MLSQQVEIGLFQRYIPLSYRLVNQGPSEYTIRLIYPRLEGAAAGVPTQTQPGWLLW